MSGYYDYHPTHLLHKPLALVGFVNAITRKVAHHLSSATGLPGTYLDDVIQHELGASSHEIIVNHGLRRWREVENRELGKAISSTPPSIISLGEGAIDHYDDLNLVLDWTNLIYLNLPSEEAIRLAARQDAIHGATLWSEVQSRSGSWDEAIHSLYKERHFNYRMARHVIQLSARNINAAAQKILTLLPAIEPEAAA
jgi:shikimate kinase